MGGFCDGVVEYRHFVGDGGDGRGVYAVYRLENVLVRTILGYEEENERTHTATVYVFPDRSVCRAESGEAAAFPTPTAGDLCQIGAGEDALLLRVAEAGFFTTGSSGGIRHIRLRLK